MQLKKKTYFDFYENDKRTDTPQDLSTSKTGGSGSAGGSSSGSGEAPPAKIPKLEPTDGDIEMADATENESTSAFDVSQQSGSSDTATIRPQIIVSPRKSSAFAKMLKSENVSVTEAAGGSGESSSFAALAQQSESNSSASNTSSASDLAAGGQSTSGSPSKSVIVRVGSSASLVSACIFRFLFCIDRVVDTVLMRKFDIQFALT